MNAVMTTTETNAALGFRLLRSEVKERTRELAEEFRNLEPSPTERELNPSRLRHLRQKAEDGRLISFHWASAVMNGKRLRMNGQHSSTMLCELNGDFPKGLRAHIDEYEASDPNGLAMLFRQFDDRKSGRSSSDVAGAYQMLNPELQGVPRPVAKLGIEGVVFWRRHIMGAPVRSGDDQYSLFDETGLHDYLIWLGDIFSIKTPELRRPPITAAMYATFTTTESAARQFWATVAAGGDGFEDNAPATVLDAWLKAAKEGEMKVEPKPAEFYQGCIYAWNAYREAKTIAQVKSDTRKGWYKLTA